MTLIEIAFGVPVLFLFAGLVNLDLLPDWLVVKRVKGKKWPYFLITYVSFVLVIPVVYFGGQFVRANELGASNLVFIVACPFAFALKYAFLRAMKVEFHDRPAGPS